jgi:hypothetical protein
MNHFRTDLSIILGHITHFGWGKWIFLEHVFRLGHVDRSSSTGTKNAHIFINLTYSGRVLYMIRSSAVFYLEYPIDIDESHFRGPNYSLSLEVLHRLWTSSRKKWISVKIFAIFAVSTKNAWNLQPFSARK